LLAAQQAQEGADTLVRPIQPALQHDWMTRAQCQTAPLDLQNRLLTAAIDAPPGCGKALSDGRRVQAGLDQAIEIASVGHLVGKLHAWPLHFFSFSRHSLALSP